MADHSSYSQMCTLSKQPGLLFRDFSYLCSFWQENKLMKKKMFIFSLLLFKSFFCPVCKPISPKTQKLIYLFIYHFFLLDNLMFESLKLAQIEKNSLHKLPRSKVTSSDCLLCATNSPKPKHIQFSIIENRKSHHTREALYSCWSTV